MIIEIPGCNWRVKGESRDWQVQYVGTKKDGTEGDWVSKYFYGQLGFAVMKLYELALRESDEIAGFADVPEKCREVSDRLLKAVRKAVSE